MSVSLEQVLRLADLGLSVFPLWDRTKKPALDKWKEFQERRPTEAELRDWFKDGNKRNAAIVHGRISNTVVIESDTPEAEAWCQRHLPSTPMQVRSSRGIHRYFRYPTDGDPIPASIPVEGKELEIKRDGQITLAPGSTHPNGHVYTELEPGWPASLSDVTEFPSHVVWYYGRSKSPTSSRRAAPLPDVISDGGRNSTLFLEGSRLRRLGFNVDEICASLLAVNASRCVPKLPDSEVETIARSCARYEPAADTFKLTESGDAEFFADQNADTVRYDHRALRWHLYQGHHWSEQTTGEVHRLALDAIRTRQVAATKLPEDLRAKHLKWAANGEARNRLSNLLALAQNVSPIADSGDDWDTQSDLLGVANGVIDLRTGALRAGRPEDRITLVSPLRSDAAASTDKWKQFVLDVCDGNEDIADYLQVVCGYILTAKTSDQCFWIFYGEGANGKSTFLEMLTRHVIPNHSWSMNFPSAKWSESMSDYQKAQLVNKRLIVSKENEQSQRLNTEFIKSLTGDESISARHPYGRPFNFRPVAKFVIAVNHKPTIDDESHGMWRRVRLVPFLRTFELNPAFAASLISEAPGVLAWAVQGSVRYYRDGLTTPKEVLAATAEYRQESDSLAPFFQERCFLGPDKSTNAQALFDELKSWYEEQQTPIFERMSQREFGRRIAADVRFTVGKGKGDDRFRVFYTGIAILERRRSDDGASM